MIILSETKDSSYKEQTFASVWCVLVKILKNITNDRIVLRSCNSSFTLNPEWLENEEAPKDHKMDFLKKLCLESGGKNPIRKW